MTVDIRYLDEDGDEIEIESDVELEAAIISCGSLLRLRLGAGGRGEGRKKEEEVVEEVVLVCDDALAERAPKTVRRGVEAEMETGRGGASARMGLKRAAKRRDKGGEAVGGARVSKKWRRVCSEEGGARVVEVERERAEGGVGDYILTGAAKRVPAPVIEPRTLPIGVVSMGTVVTDVDRSPEVNEVDEVVEVVEVEEVEEAEEVEEGEQKSDREGDGERSEVEGEDIGQPELLDNEAMAKIAESIIAAGNIDVGDGDGNDDGFEAVLVDISQRICFGKEEEEVVEGLGLAEMRSEFRRKAAAASSAQAAMAKLVDGDWLCREHDSIANDSGAGWWSRIGGGGCSQDG